MLVSSAPREMTVHVGTPSPRGQPGAWEAGGRLARPHLLVAGLALHEDTFHGSTRWLQGAGDPGGISPSLRPSAPAAALLGSLQPSPGPEPHGNSSCSLGPSSRSWRSRLFSALTPGVHSLHDVRSADITSGPAAVWTLPWSNASFLRSQQRA